MGIGWHELVQFPWEYGGQGMLYLRDDTVLIGPTRERAEVTHDYERELAHLSVRLLQKPPGDRHDPWVRSWQSAYDEAHRDAVRIEREHTTLRIWDWAHGDCW